MTCKIQPKSDLPSPVAPRSGRSDFLSSTPVTPCRPSSQGSATPQLHSQATFLSEHSLMREKQQFPASRHTTAKKMQRFLLHDTRRQRRCNDSCSTTHDGKEDAMILAPRHTTAKKMQRFLLHDTRRQRRCNDSCSTTHDGKEDATIFAPRHTTDEGLQMTRIETNPPQTSQHDKIKTFSEETTGNLLRTDGCEKKTQ